MQRTTSSKAGVAEPSGRRDQADDSGGAPKPSSTTVGGAVEADAVAHLYDQLAGAAVVNILLAVLVGRTLWGHVAPTVVLSWVAAVCLIALGRLVLYHRYQRAADPAPHTWRRWYFAGAAASGLSWGIAGPLFVPAAPSLPVLALVIALAGISAGGLPNIAAVLHVYLTFLAAILVPLAVTFFLMGGETQMLIAGMTALYGGALCVSGRNYNRHLRRAYELNARLNEANRGLEHLSRHDLLTGLKNRATLEQTLADELSPARRNQAASALVMVDIDYFKTINDTLGHGVGDKVLVDMAEVLALECRESDHAGRWGGEEFMLLLPDTHLEDAQRTAERLRQRVEAMDFGEAGSVTVSVGVAASVPGEGIRVLLKRVDDALYRAKQNGRNRIEVSEAVADGDAAASASSYRSVVE